MPAFRATRRARLLLLGAAVTAAVSTHATPASPGASDPLTAFLAERGYPRGSMSGVVRDRAAEIALAALNLLDVPYLWGGNHAGEGFDCSGFTRHLYQRIAGISLPRLSEAQASATGFVNVERSELAPGDLVFFNTLRQTFSHVGIYVGDGKFVHAPRAGAVVRVENMDHSPYWRGRFTGARRAAGFDTPGTSSTASRPKAAHATHPFAASITPQE